MLKKFIKISNVGRLRDCRASGQVGLDKVTLIHAANGRGKSTLSAILRSLSSGDPSPIVGRRTLGTTEEPAVEILVDGTNHVFRDRQWSARAPEITVFDSHFISSNVFSGEVVSLENRRNNYQVVVGAGAVELVREIEEISTKSRALSADIRVAEAKIGVHAGRGQDLKKFIGLTQVDAIDEALSAAESQVAALEQQDLVASTQELVPLALPVLPPSFAEVLTRTADSFADVGLERVRSHMAAHHMVDAERWISAGLDYATDTCGFCGQSLDKAAPLVDAYRAIFSEAYREIQVQIDNAIADVDSALGDTALKNLGSQVRDNETRLAFWRPLVRVSEVGWRLEIFDGLRALKSAAIESLEAKRARVSVVDPAPSLAKASAALATHAEFILEYNSAIELTNAAIRERKREAKVGNASAAKETLAQLRLQKKRYEPIVAEDVEAYRRLVADKDALEVIREDRKHRLESLAASTLRNHEAGINRILEFADAGFRVGETGVAYPGGPAAADFRIKIDGVSVPLGDQNTPESQASFRNTLSTGDRSLLALAFFVARLELDPDREQRIVVFDDPFNSQDSFRRLATLRAIGECHKWAKQVIILSHDDLFLRDVSDWFAARGKSVKALEMKRVSQTNTHIVPCDISAKTELEDSKNRKQLSAYYYGEAYEEQDVIKKIRLVLETYCRAVGAPDVLADDTLGVIADKLAALPSSHVLHPVADDIFALNVYTREHHHGAKPDEVAKKIDPEELRAQVGLALKIIGFK